MKPTVIWKLLLALMAGGCSGSSCGSRGGQPALSEPGPGLPLVSVPVRRPEFVSPLARAFQREVVGAIVAGRIPFLPVPFPALPQLAQAGPPGQLVHAALALDTNGEELVAPLQLGDFGEAGVSAEVLSHVDEATQERVDALVIYGQVQLAISHWNPDIDDYGIVEVFPNLGNVTRVTRYGGATTGDGACVASHASNQILFLEFMPALDLFGFTGESIPATAFAGASGNAISAFRQEAGGTTVIVTDGLPGELWKHVPAGTLTQSAAPATKVGNVGNSPRDIAFAGEIGVVSNFDSGTLTIVRWDATTDAVTILGTVSVGAGPIGLALRLDADGNIECLCTGFHDHTYTITLLSPDGAVLLGPVTQPVPDGGLNPVHAIFMDEEGTRIAISCNGSDKVVFFDRPQ